MKKIYFIVFSLLLFGCKKKSDDLPTGPQRVTYVFSPGGASSQITFKSFVLGNTVSKSYVSTLFTINDEVRLGDEILLTMSSGDKPVGNFELRVILNGKEIASQSHYEEDVTGTKFLILKKTITESDLMIDKNPSTVVEDPYTIDKPIFQPDKPFFSLSDNISGELLIPSETTGVLKFQGQDMSVDKHLNFNFEPVKENGDLSFILSLQGKDGKTNIFSYPVTILKDNKIENVWKDLNWDQFKTTNENYIVKTSIPRRHINFGVLDYEDIVGYNIESIKGFFGIYQFHFNKSTNKLDSVMIEHGNSDYDPSINLDKVSNFLEKYYGKADVINDDYHRIIYKEQYLIEIKRNTKRNIYTYIKEI